MEIRKAIPGDLDAIMRVYGIAQEFMIRSGNPTQWGHSYPTEELLSADIADGACYVTTQDGAVHAVFVLCFGGEPTYRVIENGAWPNDLPYVTIHRIASDGIVHGVFRAAADYSASLCDHIRVDTHADNRVMQRRIEAYGFVKCGTIYVADGSPRIAYQWDRPAKRGAPK
ncbi:MAG: N-acetyltransferase [Clostridia bacterium]|nr:N-acetyltransferase [Clostridia bacterium]